VLRVTALPAQDGDCLWLEWPDQDGATHRMLVDGGRGRPAVLAERLGRQPMTEREFDLVVCTHIDADHIGGLLALVADPPAGFRAHDVWFNGRDHLDVLGHVQGDQLSDGLRRSAGPWNGAFGGRAVVVPRDGALPVVELPGLRITLLSPGRAELAMLARGWPQVLEEVDADLASRRTSADTLAGRRPDRTVGLHLLARRPFEPDESPANASSIAFVAEHHDGGRVLLAADASAEVLTAGLRRLGTGQYRVDLCKVAHHGSRHNTSPELLELIDCQDWLVSTSGARFGHPSREAMGRILCRPADRATAWFNYLSPTTEEYADPALQGRFGFRGVHPPADRPGITLAVGAGRVELDR